MYAVFNAGRRQWLGWVLAVVVSLPLPLPAAAQGLQDVLLLDASLDNSRLRLIYSQLIVQVQRRRACINASPASSGYWVPRHLPRSGAPPLSFPQWGELEVVLGDQRGMRASPAECGLLATADTRLRDPWFTLYDHIAEEEQWMDALGAAYLDDDQRPALGILFDRAGRVEELTPGGPGQRAGLQPGDLLTAVAGELVFSAAGVVLRLAGRQTGQPVQVMWVRTLADGSLLQGYSQMVPLPLSVLAQGSD